LKAAAGTAGSSTTNGYSAASGIGHRSSGFFNHLFSFMMWNSLFNHHHEASYQNLESIRVANPPTKVVYKKGEDLDLNGLVVVGSYANGTEKNLRISTGNITGFDSSTSASSQDLTITVKDLSTSFTIAYED
jgi:hypothetical protein